jgi:hypothetical protein
VVFCFKNLILMFIAVCCSFCVNFLRINTDFWVRKTNIQSLWIN